MACARTCFVDRTKVLDVDGDRWREAEAYEHSANGTVVLWCVGCLVCMAMVSPVAVPPPTHVAVHAAYGVDAQPGCSN